MTSRCPIAATALACVWAATVSAQTSTPIPRFQELQRHFVPARPPTRLSCDVASAACAVDVDRDGDLDLALAGLPLAQPSIGLFLNDGQARFTDVSVTHFPVLGGLTFEIDAGDLDGDQDADLLFVNARFGGPLEPPTFFILNDGMGRFGPPQNLPFVGPDMESAEIFDADGDGDLDVFLVGFSYPHQHLLLNNGGASFIDATATHLPSFSLGGTFALARDLDADGDVDVLLATRATLQVLANGGAGHFAVAPGRFSPSPPPSYGTKHAIADIDGDLDLDVVNSDFFSDATYLCVNDGRGFFTDVSATHLPPDPTTHYGFDFLDADVDGDADILITTSEPFLLPTMQLYRNDGAGRFADATAEMLPYAPGYASDYAIGDFDADGDVDFIRSAGGGGVGIPLCRSPIYLNRTRQLHAPSAPIPGALYSLDAYGGAGQWSLLLVGGRRAAVLLPPFGILGIDPTAALVLPGVLPIDPTGNAPWRLPVPPNAALAGTAVYAQSLLIDPAAPAQSRLTNLVVDIVQ